MPEILHYLIKRIKSLENRGRNFDLKTDYKQSLWFISGLKENELKNPGNIQGGSLLSILIPNFCTT